MLEPQIEAERIVEEFVEVVISYGNPQTTWVNPLYGPHWKEMKKNNMTDTLYLNHRPSSVFTFYI